MKKFFSGIVAAIIIMTVCIGMAGTTFSAGNTEKSSTNAMQLKSGGWKKTYHKYFYNEYNGPDSAFYWDGSTYELIYLDNNKVPEIWVVGPDSASGCCLVSIKNGSVKTTLFGMGSLKYLKKKNKFIHSGGKMGDYYDYVYKLKKGRAVVVAKGEYVEQYSDDGFKPVGIKYTWNGKKVSKKKYKANLNKHVKPAKAKVLTGDTYNYDKFMKYLKK